MRKFKLKFGIDVDDILFKCNEYAIELANAKYQFNPPLTLDELNVWGRSGKRSDVIFEYYEREDFFQNQPLVEMAKEFIQTLIGYGDVFFITAVAPQFMSIRAQRLIEEFPEVPASNIIMGSCKNMVKVDILLDDGAHNILASDSTYPVLMRKPWNQHMTGCLSVNNFGEFFALVETIIQSSRMRKNVSTQKNRVIALIGPSASGKTVLLKEMVRLGMANKVTSYTTRARREHENEDAYHFIDKKMFRLMEQSNCFFETTRYAGECYGSSLNAVEEALKTNHAVMAVDICGAMALKHVFSDALLVYIDRPKEDLINSILERNCSNQEKTKRILSLNDERKNEGLCDITIGNTGTVEDMARELSKEL